MTGITEFHERFGAAARSERLDHADTELRTIAARIKRGREMPMTTYTSDQLRRMSSAVSSIVLETRTDADKESRAGEKRDKILSHLGDHAKTHG